MANGITYNWSPLASGGSSGISTYANFAAFPVSASDGAVALALDTDILYAFNSGSNSWVIIGGPGSILSVGTIDSTTASANGAAVLSNALIMQSASATVPGLVNITTQTFSGVKTFTNPIVGTQSQGDGSTKAASTSYVDVAVSNAVSGINPAVAVQAATTSAGDTSGFTYNNGVSGVGATLTGSVNTAVTIDGYTFTAVGQRLLVKNDTQSPSGAFNGIYSLTVLQTSLVAPVFTRALDYNSPSSINNTGAIPVVNGTLNTTTSWVQTAQVVTVGTTPLVFTEFTKNPADYVLVSSLGNLTDAGTDGIVVTGGTGVTVGSVSLAQHVADTTHNGYLSSTDWNTFNGKQAAGSYITSLTGGVTASGPGAASATVVTNANLTGVITSVGNATSIASQTGTGTKFVVDNTPTLVTPIIGAATGTSLSVSGQLTSTVATGTAPLVVSSTTQVANLNAATAGSATTATTATNATNVATTATNSTNASFFPAFVASSSSGNQGVDTATGLTFNPSTNTLATTTFSGALSGNATTATSATSATNATNTAITDDTSTNATMYPTWVTTTTGNLPQKVSSTKLTFNPSTAALTTTSFVGALTGNASTATAPASGTSHGAVVLNTSGNFTSVAPSTSGFVLTSNGTDWTSAASPGFAYLATSNTSVYGGTNSTLTFTGADNLVIGSGAGGSLTTETDNTFIGWQAGKVTTGSLNTMLGAQAGVSNTSATENTYVGYHAARLATTADFGVIIGSRANGTGILTGTQNVAIGYNSLLAGTSAANNVIIGAQSGAAQTTQGQTVIIGSNAGRVGPVGADCTIVGYNAGRNTTAINAVVMGSGAASTGVMTGADNTIIGFGAGNAITSGLNAVIIGSGAVNSGVMTGTKNIVIGKGAGVTMTSGHDNTIIGAGADASVTTRINAIVIGSGAVSTADNSCVIGTASTTQNTLFGNVSATSFTGSLLRTVTASKTSAYTAVAGDFIPCNANGGTFAITFPTASSNTGATISMYKSDSSANAVTFTSGPSTGQLSTQYEFRAYISDGTNWILTDWNSSTDTTSYTPTIAGCGTVSANSAWWHREGDWVSIWGKFTTGTCTGAVVTISLPTGVVLDSTFIESNAGGTVIGEIAQYTSTANPAFPGTSRGLWPMVGDASGSTSAVYASKSTSSGAIVHDVGTNLFNDSAVTSFKFRIPVSAWGR